MIISRIVFPPSQIKLIAVDPHNCKNPEDFLVEISQSLAVFVNFYRGRKFSVALGASLNGHDCLFLCLYPKAVRFFRTSRYMLPLPAEFASCYSQLGQGLRACVDGKDLGRIIYKRLCDLFAFPGVADFFPIKKRHFYQFSQILSCMQKDRRLPLDKIPQAKRIFSCLSVSNQILNFITQRCQLRNLEFSATERGTLTYGDLKQFISQTEAGWRSLGKVLESYLIGFTNTETNGKKNAENELRHNCALYFIQLTQLTSKAL